MTDLQVKYQNLQETQRHNLEQEEIGKGQAVAALQSAESNLKRAKTEEERSKWEKEMAKWKNILGTINTGLDVAESFTLTPMSQSEFFKNVGQGFGSSAQGVSALFGPGGIW